MLPEIPVACYQSLPSICHYGFISYAHKDAARVLPVIAALSRDRFRLWYDAGIEAGDNWPEVVADHLRRAGTVVFFLSRRFLHSQNCVREVHYAVDRRKPMIAVYLEPLELPSDLAMQFSTATVIQGAEAAPEAIAAEAEGLLGPGFLGDGVTGYETVRIHKPQKNPWRTLSLVFLSLFVLTALLVAGYLGGLLPSLGARTVTVDQAPGAAAAEAVTVTTFQDAFSRDILLRAYQGTSLYLCGNALVSDPAAIRRQGGVWTVAHEPVSPGNPDVLTLVAEKSDLMGLALVDQGIESFEGLTGLQHLVYLDIGGPGDRGPRPGLLYDPPLRRALRPLLLRIEQPDALPGQRLLLHDRSRVRGHIEHRSRSPVHLRVQHGRHGCRRRHGPVLHRLRGQEQQRQGGPPDRLFAPADGQGHAGPLPVQGVQDGHSLPPIGPGEQGVAEGVSVALVRSHGAPYRFTITSTSVPLRASSTALKAPSSTYTASRAGREASTA